MKTMKLLQLNPIFKQHNTSGKMVKMCTHQIITVENILNGYTFFSIVSKDYIIVHYQFI